MATDTTANKDALKVLRMVALRYPQAELGIACQGTALESSTVTARDKAFLFMSGVVGPSYTVRVKLCQSQTEAMELAAKEPSRYKLGVHCWTTISFSDSAPPPMEHPDLSIARRQQQTIMPIIHFIC